MVLLVKFAPTLAFFTWLCLQNLPSELVSSGGTYLHTSLAESCAFALRSNQEAIGCLIAPSPKKLLPEGILPVTQSAAYLQDPVNKSNLQPEITILASFLTSLQPENFRDSPQQSWESLQGRQQNDSPALSLPAARSADCESPASCSTADSTWPHTPSLLANADASASQQQDVALSTRLMGALHAAILTTKLLTLAQPVKHVTSLKDRHGVLLNIAVMLFQEVQAIDDQMKAAGIAVPAQHATKLELCTGTLMSNVTGLLHQSTQPFSPQDPQWSLLCVAKVAIETCFHSCVLPRAAALQQFHTTGVGAICACHFPCRLCAFSHDPAGSVLPVAFVRYLAMLLQNDSTLLARTARPTYQCWLTIMTTIVLAVIPVYADMLLDMMCFPTANCHSISLS